jgi:uncharacterized protein
MNTHSWLHPGLEKRESATQGAGIFAGTDIRKGELLSIFGGKVMLIDEMYQLPEDLQRFTMQIEERFVLGPAGTVPEDTDYFNHSCDPNSGFRGQVFLVAMRDISAGEEITFDYAMTVSESVGSEMVFSMECRCGSSLCRKRITEQDWMLPELHARYGSYFSQYIREKIERLGEPGTHPVTGEIVASVSKKAGLLYDRTTGQ